MTGSGRSPEQTEWRAWGESWLAVLIPALVALGGLVFVAQAVSHPNGWNPLSVVLALFGLLMAAVGVFFVVLLVRTRTRLTEEGIEIRQTAPEVLAWSEITSVQLDRSNAERTITVSLRDGSVRTLPTPTQGKRSLSDSTLADAVAAMRRRLGS